MAVEAHYDEQYFAWQKEVAKHTIPYLNKRFQPHIKPTDKVIEFGSGAGFLLNSIQCKDKVGIEINPTAIAHANSLGLRIVENIDDIEDEWADCIISNSVLEHIPNPFEVITALRGKLKPGGTIVFRVPQEIYAPYHPDNPDMHLFTWSRMNLGNLFASCGYSITFVKRTTRVLPPFYKTINKLLGSWWVQAIGSIYSVTIHYAYCRIFWKMPVYLKYVELKATKPQGT